jgi:hypothetical protein
MAAVIRVTKSLPACIYFLGVRNVLRGKDQFDSDQRRRLRQRRESGHRRKSELGPSADISAPPSLPTIAIETELEEFRALSYLSPACSRE